MKTHPDQERRHMPDLREQVEAIQMKLPWPVPQLADAMTCVTAAEAHALCRAALRSLPAQPQQQEYEDGRRVGHSRLVYDKTTRTIVRKSPPQVQHSGECETDEYARTVCEGMYVKRTDELLGLVEALRAIRALAGGYGEQAKAVTKLVDDAIEEHAAWTK